ncbi:MAG TPA: hypothetical protein VM219_04530 [Phycisphaerae bacterium]|nr:hypothetical protein [Phycisphaerae bacterium]
MKWLVVMGAGLALCAASHADEQVYRTDHVAVTYSDISEQHAEAIARAVEAARAVAVETFTFDMPETIHVSVRLDQSVRLFNDGQDRFFLTVRAERDLRKPQTTGIFHIYGLCHEIGHLAQYRPIKNRGWMTTAAAEGWAHYVGSRLVDAVYEREGPDLWPDKYDYRADGMARLKRQIAAARRDEADDGAALWMELAEIVGDKGIAPIFKSWGDAKTDPTDPGPTLKKVLLAGRSDKPLKAWWQKAEPVLVAKREKSMFVTKQFGPKDLAGRPVALKYDDGTPSGKSSMAGGGHAVRFKTAAEGWCVTAVAVYGARYGRPEQGDTFQVWLCDADFKPFAELTFPYSVFSDAKWVALPVTPTLVPPEFIVCVGFNPTASKGVFVHYDAAGSGQSLSGLPGKVGRLFERGDWLIRVRVDKCKRPPAAKR